MDLLVRHAPCRLLDCQFSITIQSNLGRVTCDSIYPVSHLGENVSYRMLVSLLRMIVQSNHIESNASVLERSMEAGYASCQYDREEKIDLFPPVGIPQTVHGRRVPRSLDFEVSTHFAFA